MIHFDFDNRYQDELVVGNALSRREGFVWSVIVHVVGVGVLFVLAQLVIPTVEPPQNPPDLAQEVPQQARIVFIEPLMEKPPQQPREQFVLSDRDRRAETPAQPVPQNPLPFSRGNTTDLTEPAPAPSTPGEPEPPTSPPEPIDTRQPEEQLARNTLLPRRPSTTAEPAPAPAPVRTPRPRVLRRAGENPQLYMPRNGLENPQGGDSDLTSSFQFDSKGVDFGSWLRRFRLQVMGNWLPYIPQSAMVFSGHVVLQFYVHKDGSISEMRVLRPSDRDAFRTAAVNAITSSNPTAPLPSEYPADKMLMTVGFFYNELPPD